MLIGFIEKYKGQPLSFGSWMAFALPQLVLCLLMVWIWLQIYYLPLPFCSKATKNQSEQDTELEQLQKDRIAKLIKAKWEELGSVTYQEATVAVSFIILVLFWFFRSPGFSEGWGDKLMAAYGDDIGIKASAPTRHKNSS